jgi:hypothetical protein
MKGLSLETEEAIRNLQDWWCNSTPEDFIGYAMEMCKYGMPEDEAVQLLDNIFHTVANEYGD